MVSNDIIKGNDPDNTASGKTGGRGKAGHSLLLLLTAFIWGLAFVSQSKGMDYMHPFTFNGVRALIGAFSLVCYLGVSRWAAGRGRRKAAGKTQPAEKRIDWPLTIRAGLWCGLALTVASTLQQFGIKYTTVGKAGFITTLYIIFVPIGGIFLGRKIPGITWVGAVMAAAGMYLLCMQESLVLGSGDIMVFLCAIVFAVHIMLVDHYSPKTDGVVISCIQFTVCGVLCSIGALIWGHPTWAQLWDGRGTLLYAGVLSCGVAYTLQVIGQKGVNPTVAALLLSLESVFATLAGWVAYRIGFLGTDQSMTGRQVAGCVLVFAAVILVQLPGKFFKRKNRS